jgi:Cu/Ag efflux pump CusA
MPHSSVVSKPAFSNLRDVLLMFTTVPPGLWLNDISISSSAEVGFIGLSGVAVLNGPVELLFMRERKRDRPIHTAGGRAPNRIKCAG